MTLITDVMSGPAETITTGDTVGQARELMQDIGVHALPVLDGGGGLAGIVTSLDLAENMMPTAPVDSAMSDQVHVVRPDTEVAMAALLMRGLEINHLVVVDDDDGVVGIVSSWDLLESLAGSVRAHTVHSADLAPVVTGDELIVHRAGHTTPLRCRVQDVRGPNGLPPYIVVWDDDPSRSPVEIEIVRHGDTALDGCER